MQYLKSKTIEIDDRIWLSCRKSNQEWEVMEKGREVIADGDDHHNQPHSILVCVVFVIFQVFVFVFSL